MRAISSCWSTGKAFSLALNCLNFPHIQCGKLAFILATVSPVLPGQRRLSAAPPQPDSLETTMANRSSWAPAHTAALPRRE